MVLILLVLLLLYCSGQTDNDYTLVEADIRNIIFVGRGRAGKTTLINVLKDKNYNPPLFDIVRGTKYAKLESFTNEFEKV